MLTVVNGTSPPGLGEPINIIISGNSDSLVLSGEGFIAYAQSVGFGGECLSAHLGGDQMANLGDGSGVVVQEAVHRQDYGDPSFGVCQETINGGNHFRIWTQNGSAADSGALFLASSIEQNLNAGHDIAANGYDDGRDNIVKNATSSANGTFTSSWSFNSTVEYITDLLPVGSTGINHGIAIDGRVALLTVKVTHFPPPNITGTASSPSSSPTTAPASGAHANTCWSNGFIASLVLVGTLTIL